MASARTKIRVSSQDGTSLAEYLLGEGVHTMGRDPSSAIYLESDYVSGEHARLHLSSTGIAIEDLNSTSGTFLDEVAVRGKLDIEPGQKIRVGDLQVDLEVEGVGEIAAGASLGAGRYTLVQELGRGAMGTVWLATDNELQEEVAIKLLAPELAGDAVTLADLKREVQKSRKLSHENIIRIHDLNNLPGELPFITMEYIWGSNMDAVRLNQPDGLMKWDHLRPILLQLCEALDYAHRQKIVHRDLKPANMMVTKDYTLKLADFGIAATLNDSTARSSLAGTVSGTLTYMSPQQLQGEDPRGSDDIYSLGATLYNLITGRPPFKSGDVRGQILNQSPTPLTQVLGGAGVVSDIPDYVSGLVMACLAKDPEDRPQNGKAIIEWIVTEGRSELIAKKKTSLFKFKKSSAAGPAKPPPPASATTAKPNKKLIIGIAAVAIVAVLAVAGVLLLGKGAAAQEPGTLLWSFETGGEVKSSPAIGADGTVYFGSQDMKVYALDGRNGTKKWEYTAGNRIGAPPAIGTDGTVYIGTGLTGAELLALDGATGEKKWAFRVGQGIPSSPAIGQDGALYFASKTKKVYALNRDGSSKWEFPTEGEIYSNPAIGADGTVYVGSSDKKLYALDGHIGDKLWEFETGDNVTSSPAIGTDGAVYIGSKDGKVYAINGKTGNKLWEFQTQKAVTSSPVIGSDDTVYVGSDDKKVYALDRRSGAKKWEFKTEGPVHSIPAIGSDGMVYVGSSDNKVYALDGRSGAKKWEFETGGKIHSSPTIGTSGILYVGSEDGKIYAIATSSKGLAKSPWPMRGRNAAHSGRMTVRYGFLHSKSQLEKDAADGDFLAQNLMGNYYRDGRLGFPRDHDQSVIWHTKSAEAGYVWAQHFLGMKYLSDNQGVKQDYALALNWFEKAAEQNHGSAMTEIGKLYENGKGTDLDEQAAFDWYRKAAIQGDKEAVWYLGSCFQLGKCGQTVDFIKAKAYFERGVALKSPRSAFSLGSMYENGSGVPKDLGKAVAWYGQAAKMRHSWAYHKMAVVMQQGWTGAPSIEGAYAWYLALAEDKRLDTGDDARDRAIKILGELRLKMTPAQISQATKIKSQIQTDLRTNK